jgi:GDP-D-mannose dehydratase
MGKTLKKKKVALITGITGQDGSYLAEILLSKGYKVHGLIRRSSSQNKERIDHLRGKIQYHYGDITDPFSLLWILKKSNPDEIYHLAAQSHVQVSWEIPWLTAQTTGIGVLNLLESVRVLGMEKKVRIYNASTSEMFSGLENEKQNEDTPKDPVSPYGTAKLYGFQICKNYRGAFGMFISNGILFNHESPRRGDNFVTKKIVNEAVNGEVTLGNVEASRDWGYAPEYCEAMWLMLQQDKPDDFVIATGETHTVKEFVEWVGEAYGLKIKIIHDESYDRPKDVPVLCGDSSKARKAFGWNPRVHARELAEIMVKKTI